MTNVRSFAEAFEKQRTQARNRARETKILYDAYLEVGFTPEQSWQLIQEPSVWDEIFR